MVDRKGAMVREMRCLPSSSGPDRMNSISSSLPGVADFAPRACIGDFELPGIGGTGGTFPPGTTRLLLRSPLGEDAREPATEAAADAVAEAPLI